MVLNLDGINDSVDMSLSKFIRWWRRGKPGTLQSRGFQRVRHDWVTEQQRNGAKHDTGHPLHEEHPNHLPSWIFPFEFRWGYMASSTQWSRSDVFCGWWFQASRWVSSYTGYMDITLNDDGATKWKRPGCFTHHPLTRTSPLNEHWYILCLFTMVILPVFIKMVL